MRLQKLAASTTGSSLSTFHCIIQTQCDCLLGCSGLPTSTRPISLDSTSSIVQIIFPRLDILIHPFRNFEECSLHAFSRFRTRLDISHHTLSPAPFFGFFLGDCSPVVACLVCEIALVAHQYYNDILLCDLAQIMQPPCC